MFRFLEKYLMAPMTKISQIRLVRAITAAGMSSITFTIVGSIFLVFNVLPLTIPALTGFFEATFFKFSDLYMLAFKATMGLISLYFLLVISYEYTKIIASEEGLDLNPMTGTLLGVFGLFMLIPEFVKENNLPNLLNDPEAGIINGWAVGGDGLSRLGATGIFTAIIVSWLVVNIYKFCIKRKLFVKLPDTVPDGVSRSFSALIPAFVVAFTFIIINSIFVMLGTDLYKLVAIPFGFVTNLAGSYIGTMVIFFLVSALWIVGIHGATIIFSLLTPIFLNNLGENINGASNVLAGEFANAFVYMGGSGATLGLIIMLIFLAKSDQLKLLGKASIVPGLFNINEPIIFGLPIVYNPYMALPFFLAPMASASLAYIAIKTGFVGPIVAQQPWPTPIGLGAFIATGGDWKAIIVAIACALLAALIYYPFLIFYDKKLLKEQEEGK